MGHRGPVKSGPYRISSKAVWFNRKTVSAVILSRHEIDYFSPVGHHEQPTGIPSGPGPGHADADIATKLGAADEPTAGTDMATKPTATANIANTRRANFMEISP